MSLDGVSRKSVPPSLRLATTNAKLAPTESLQRRPVEEKRPIPIGQLESPRPIETPPAAQRRYPRYVLAANTAQLLLDILLLASTQTTVFLLIYQRLGLERMSQAIVVVFFSVPVVLLLFYATGCYRRDAILNNSLSMSRLPVALSFSAAVLFVALHYGFPFLYPSARVYLSISRDVTIILIGTSISLGAALVSRAIIRIMLNLNLFRRRVLVI